MLLRLLPETLFHQKLSQETAQRVRVAQALAEEALIRTHVTNALHFIDLLDPELGFERAIELYVRELMLPEALGAVVINRTLVTLSQPVAPADLVTDDHGATDAPAAPRSELHLADIRFADSRRRRA